MTFEGRGGLGDFRKTILQTDFKAKILARKYLAKKILH